MFIFTTIKLAIEGLLANKTRALLTLLGIIVGVGSVILLLAYSGGVEKSLLDRFKGWGATRLQIGINSWMDGVRDNETITDEDVEEIRNEVWMVDSIARFHVNSYTVKYSTQDSDNKTVFCAEPETWTVMQRPLSSGRYYDAMDEAMRNPVCVIGGTLAEDLFYNEPAIGKEIAVNGKRLTVIGVMEELGGPGWINNDNDVFTPLSVSDFIDPATFKSTDLLLNIKDVKYMQYAEQWIKDIIYANHPHLPLPEDEDDDQFWRQPIGVMRLYEVIIQYQTIAQSMARFLIVMGALALLIGGIGVMNIMLVSVEERTPEIGLRKALGAPALMVMGQFLLEAVAVCMIGGALGTTLAVIACRYLARLPDDMQVPDPQLTPVVVTVAIVVTLAIGVVSGFYPAYRAAQLDPIESLRYE